MIAPAVTEADEIILIDPPVAPTFDELVADFAAAGFTVDQARDTIGVLKRLVSDMNSFACNVVHLTNEQLRKAHAVMDVMMPDNIESQPGSIHRRSEDYLIAEGLMEPGSRLLHVRVPGRQVEYCAVELRRIEGAA